MVLLLALHLYLRRAPDFDGLMYLLLLVRRLVPVILELTGDNNDGVATQQWFLTGSSGDSGATTANGLEPRTTAACAPV